MHYSQLLRYVTPHRATLVFIVALLLAGTGVSLLNPLIAGKLTQTILEGSRTSGFTINSILLFWLGLLVLHAAVNASSRYLIGYTGARMSAELRSRTYEHMQILPLAYYQERKQGDILALLSNDAGIVGDFVTQTVVSLLPMLLTFFTAFAVMFWLDPLIAVLAALLIPAYYLAMKLIGRRLRPLSSAWVKSWGDMVALVNENLGMIPAIKNFTRERVESERFGRRNAELLELWRKQTRVSAILSPAVGLLASTGLLLLVWVGTRHLESGQLQPAELVSLLLYAMLLTRPLAGLADVYGQVMTTRGAAERLLEFFAEAPEPMDSGDSVLPALRGDIEYRNVTFAYPGREPVLRNFNLKINAGETIALTGPNGAGKSTLVHLLMRFIEPQQGQVLIDSFDTREAQLASLREQVGLVAQHTLLLNGTVAENITYGHTEASGDEMRQAAESARASGFIDELPRGYDTVIGDQGVKLSGGQRQRLSLARSLLKNPPILVLDEATAMFDPEGEKEFIEECAEALAQRTVILITHRPASLALADRTCHLG